MREPSPREAEQGRHLKKVSLLYLCKSHGQIHQDWNTRCLQTFGQTCLAATRLCGTFGGLYMTSGNSQCSCAGLRTRLHTIWAWKTSWSKCSNVLALMQRPRGSGNAPLCLASEGSSRSGLPQFLYHARATEDPFGCVKS